MPKPKERKDRLFCPYCDEEIKAANFPYCQVCQVTIFYGPQCRQPVPRGKRNCPHCGTEIKG